jgi:hypothetical protein
VLRRDALGSAALEREIAHAPQSLERGRRRRAAPRSVRIVPRHGAPPAARHSRRRRAQVNRGPARRAP